MANELTQKAFSLFDEFKNFGFDLSDLMSGKIVILTPVEQLVDKLWIIHGNSIKIRE